MAIRANESTPPGRTAELAPQHPSHALHLAESEREQAEAARHAEQAVLPDDQQPKGSRTSRRRLLGRAAKAAAATVAVGALLAKEGSSTAHAQTGTFSSSGSGTAAVTATGTNGADGVDATTDTGTALSDTATMGGTGVSGVSGNPAVFSSDGVFGQSFNPDSNNGRFAGVHGINESSGIGVLGQAGEGFGVLGYNQGPTPIFYPLLPDPSSVTAGVVGTTGDQIGVFGFGGDIGIGVAGFGPSAGPGVQGAGNVIGVQGVGPIGVIGSNTLPGPGAIPNFNTGVIGINDAGGTGVLGTSSSSSSGTAGVVAQNTGGGAALLVSEGSVQVQSPAVGQVTMAAASTSVTVSNAVATPNSLILLTPLNNPGPGVIFWISARSTGSFTINASRPVSSAVTLLFLIIN